jgi:hypothetical protein
MKVYIPEINNLFKAEEEYEHLLGVDYSSPAIELSKSVAKKMGLNISFEVIILEPFTIIYLSHRVGSAGLGHSW